MKDVNLLVSNGVNVEKSLELFGDMQMYDSTLEDFLNEIGNRLDRIKKYKEISDMANYAIEVHALKSDSKYFGFDKLAELAYNHEMESKKNNMFYVVDHYDELITEANRIVKLVNEYLGREIVVKTIDEVDTVIKDKTILVYCRSGKRATTAVEKLKRLGYTAYNMGGIANIDLPKE